MLRLLFTLAFLLPAAAHAQDSTDFTRRLVAGAHQQVGVTLRYDAAYVSLPFPGGDVPMDRGVCTDVVVRAYRAVGVDLQLLVNQDMRKVFSAYPHAWGLSKPDSNIDHRRVLNLGVFFTRHGQSFPVTAVASDYKSGDIVAWRLPDGRPHIGLVSDRQENGTPLMVHNIGAGAQVENVLFTFSIIGHYRYAPENL
jgi:uncharacterized protein